MSDSPAAAASPGILGAAPAGHGETVPPDEAAAMQAVVAAISQRVRTAAETAPARRDAHPKAHGCVSARFTVLDDLPPALRVGVFQAPRSFEAWIRFSNGNEKPQADRIGDGRGMAVKLLGVAGSPSGTQDFLMINAPRFFVRNAADYVDFQSAEPQWRFFLPGFNPFRFRLHELGAALAITAQKVANPLNIRYWSMTPSAFGDAACKFSARPVGPPSPFVATGADDFLRANLAAHLAQGPASFDFMIQLQGDPAAMPIEDPTIAWSEDAAPFVPVARITIPPQTFDSPAQKAFCENLSFTPWHSLPAHRPLGGINRMRRVVYETISALRHALNGAPRQEPTSAPDGQAGPIGLNPERPNNGNGSGGNIMASWFEREILSLFGGLVQENGWLTLEASHLVINKACNSTRNRPHPWSTYAPYPTWRGLFDRTYLARHLPPAPPDDPAAPAQPDAREVAKLFARPAEGPRYSTKSTCLFPAFAQYLTDGFIRTVPTCTQLTTSNHEIDLCPLYGLNVEQTDALRTLSEAPDQKGKLKSQFIEINGVQEEFPPFLFEADGQTVKPEFAVLNPPMFTPGQPPSPPAPLPIPPQDWEAGRAASLFAVGGDRVNSSPFSAMMNTLLLREHNRVAGQLAAGNPGWDDDRVFQTARNIMIPMFIKIVVEEYINHITPLPFNIKADPSVAWTATWNRPNWMTAEFSLLYRWHSLMPDEIAWQGGAIPIGKFTLDNRPLLQIGLDAAFSAASAQPTSRLGAFNTAAFLLQVEMLSISQARDNQLASYNAYRQAFGMDPATSFDAISSNPDVQALLQELYVTPDKVEFYPGLFAEDPVPDSPLPPLLMTMVAVDAFSQALTNPLLSQHVWQDNPTLTFTDWGFNLIHDTSTLSDILRRQGRPPAAPPVTMTQLTWTYASD